MPEPSTEGEWTADWQELPLEKSQIKLSQLQGVFYSNPHPPLNS